MQWLDSSTPAIIYRRVFSTPSVSLMECVMLLTCSVIISREHHFKGKRYWAVLHTWFPDHCTHFYSTGCLTDHVQSRLQTHHCHCSMGRNNHLSNTMLKYFGSAMFKNCVRKHPGTIKYQFMHSNFGVKNFRKTPKKHKVASNLPVWVGFESRTLCIQAGVTRVKRSMLSHTYHHRR